MRSRNHKSFEEMLSDHAVRIIGPPITRSQGTGSWPFFYSVLWIALIQQLRAGAEDTGRGHDRLRTGAGLWE